MNRRRTVAGSRVRCAASAVALLATVVIAAGAHAQAATGERGDRVRVVILPDHPNQPSARHVLTGRLVAEDSANLTIEVHRHVSPIRIPRGWIGGMWISDGPETLSRAALSGLVRGGAIGAGLGAMVGAEVAAGTDEDFLRAVMVRAAAYGFSIGASTAFARMLRPGERWRSVPVRPAARAGLGARVGPTLGLEAPIDQGQSPTATRQLLNGCDMHSAAKEEGVHRPGSPAR
jgi:hypothetical protein